MESGAVMAIIIGFPFILGYHDLACGWCQLPDPGDGPPPWPPKEAMTASNLEGCSDVDTVSELLLASHFVVSHGWDQSP